MYKLNLDYDIANNINNNITNIVNSDVKNQVKYTVNDVIIKKNINPRDIIMNVWKLLLLIPTSMLISIFIYFKNKNKKLSLFEKIFYFVLPTILTSLYVSIRIYLMEKINII